MNGQNDAPTIRLAHELGVDLAAAHGVSDLIGAAFGVDGVILLESDLPPEFMDLRSGRLGELFQKLVTYRLPAALVVPDPAAHGERFVELAREHARHPQVRILPTVEDARAWLSRMA